jgi:hypothetical protein
MVDMKNKAFENWETNRVRLTFSNGNSISTIWGLGSMTDAANQSDEYGRDRFDNDQCEIMYDCSDKLRKKIEKKYPDSDNPIGYLSIEEWAEIVYWISKDNHPTLTD